METSLPDDTDGESYTVGGFCKAENIGHTKFYEEVNSGRLRAKKIGRKTIILPEDRRKWRASLPEYVPANGGGTEGHEGAAPGAANTEPLNKAAVAAARQSVPA